MRTALVPAFDGTLPLSKWKLPFFPCRFAATYARARLPVPVAPVRKLSLRDGWFIPIDRDRSFFGCTLLAFHSPKCTSRLGSYPIEGSPLSLLFSEVDGGPFSQAVLSGLTLTIEL